MNPDSCDAPRWRNGPPICKATNLPAFETEQALRKFVNSLGDGAIVIERIGRCRVCDGYHAVTHIRAASDSSGKIPAYVEEGNRRMSERAAKKYATTRQTTPKPK